MSPRFVLGGGGNVPCVAEVVNRSLKPDCTDFQKNLLESFNNIRYKQNILLSQFFVRFSPMVKLWTIFVSFSSKNTNIILELVILRKEYIFVLRGSMSSNIHASYMMSF